MLYDLVLIIVIIFIMIYKKKKLNLFLENIIDIESCYKMLILNGVMYTVLIKC